MVGSVESGTIGWYTCNSVMVAPVLRANSRTQSKVAVVLVEKSVGKRRLVIRALNGVLMVTKKTDYLPGSPTFSCYFFLCSKLKVISKQ